MDEKAILHYPESKFCFATNKNTVCLRLRISKSDVPEKIGVYTAASILMRSNAKRR
ncbi:MAG: alpha amylase N-terminal ig-like domain-containing protein, partial [Clostridia bacterium]|nr:alpha amylase N-terminal ig-like domain-containing protein [Clostridia bacterium]